MLKKASSDERYEILSDAWEAQTLNLATCNLQIGAQQSWKKAIEAEYGDSREYYINEKGELSYKAGE